MLGLGFAPLTHVILGPISAGTRDMLSEGLMSSTYIALSVYFLWFRGIVPGTLRVPRELLRDTCSRNYERAKIVILND